jgi:hypothetical protein
MEGKRDCAPDLSVIAVAFVSCRLTMSESGGDERLEERGNGGGVAEEARSGGTHEKGRRTVTEVVYIYNDLCMGEV